MRPAITHSKGATGSKATAQLKVRHPPARVWPVLADYAEVHRFHPGVKRSWAEGGPARGIGAERRCSLSPMGQLHERVVGWEEGRSITSLALTIKGLVGVKDLRGHWQVDPDDGGSRVSVTLSWVPAGAMGWLLDGAMMRPMFARGAGDAVAGLARYLAQTERGDP